MRGSLVIPFVAAHNRRYALFAGGGRGRISTLTGKGSWETPLESSLDPILHDIASDHEGSVRFGFESVGWVVLSLGIGIALSAVTSQPVWSGWLPLQA